MAAAAARATAAGDAAEAVGPTDLQLEMSYFWLERSHEARARRQPPPAATTVRAAAVLATAAAAAAAVPAYNSHRRAAPATQRRRPEEHAAAAAKGGAKRRRSRICMRARRGARGCGRLRDRRFAVGTAPRPARPHKAGVKPTSPAAARATFSPPSVTATAAADAHWASRDWLCLTVLQERLPADSLSRANEARRWTCCALLEAQARRR